VAVGEAISEDATDNLGLSWEYSVALNHAWIESEVQAATCSFVTLFHIPIPYQDIIS
jgi:hypothetical protein